MVKKCISVDQEVYDKIELCRIMGKESFSEILGRVVKFYIEKYNGKVEFVPQFAKNNTAGNIPNQTVTTNVPLSNEQL